MKKFFLILMIVVLVLIGLILITPLFFKDTLLNVLDREIEKNIRAEVYFDRDNVDISLIKNFPNLTISLEDIGVVGVEEFQGDTLADIERFDLTVNLKSLIWGDQIQLNSMNMVNPQLMILILEDGTTNYDIMVETEETAVDTGAEEEMSVGIDHWTIRNGQIAYFDQSANMIVTMEGLDHTGTGDFTETVFDMETSSTVENLMVRYEDITYLQDKKLKADMIIHMDLDETKYTFRENKISLNDFSFGLNGFLILKEESYDIDLSYEGKDNTVKSLLSLVPGAYKEGYENVKAEGEVNFSGNVKGVYNEKTEEIPAFHLELNARDGTIQYPDLPEAIRNIQIDMLVDNNGKNMDQTKIDVNRFHLDFGNNPVDATIKINNLVNYDMIADIKARLNLDEVTKIYPLKDTELSGNVDLDVHIEGVYDSVNKTIPMSGKIDVDQLKYSGPDLPMDFGIQRAAAELDTRRITLNVFTGNIGNTDLNLSGYINNYMAYVIEENMPLQAEFDLRSKQVDLNEWLAADESGDQEEDTVALEVVKIPENLDFILRSEMDLVYYDNLELKGVKGTIRIKDGILMLENLDFNTLGGNFGMAGNYDTRDMDHPSYDFELDINKLSIPQAYKAFFTIRQLAPIANLMEGNFSTDFRLSGELKPNMMPDLTTISGSGILEILNAAVKGAESKVISGITSLTKLSDESTNVTLKDVLMTTQITDGRVLVEPFTISLGGNQAVVAGSHGLDGSLDYRITLDIPPGLVQSASSLVSSAIGKDINVNAKDLKLNLGIGGTYNDPNINILGAETGGTEEAAKEALRVVIDEEKEKLTSEAEKKLDEETDKLLEQTIDTVEHKEIKEEVDRAKETLKNLLKKKK
ncbi:MAG: AsmA family protein [Cyclobacteriaceae bacterium]|nr:AsmA family protein [Cyclobacteriaceae bacterium]